MAMLFHDEVYLRCPSCGSVELRLENVMRAKHDVHEKEKLIAESLYSQLVCAKCGELVRKLRKAADVRLIS